MHPFPWTTGASLVLLAVLSGCGGKAPEEQPPADRMRFHGSFLTPEIAAKMPAFSTLVCTKGIRLLPFPETNVTLDECNFEVTTKNREGNEVTIAVNPRDPLNLIASAKDYTLGQDHSCGNAKTGWNVWLGTYWSTDGGKTWGNDLMPGHPHDNRTSPLTGNICNTDPVALYDADGSAWLSGLNYRGARASEKAPGTNPEGNDLYSGSQVYFAKSTDGGATYSQFGFASKGDNDRLFNDKQWYALHPLTGEMVVTWSAFVGPNVTIPADVPQFGHAAVDEILWSLSADDGKTWSAPRAFQTALGGASYGQFSMPVYGPDQEIYVIWADALREASLSPTSDVVFTKSTQRDAGMPVFLPAMPGPTMTLVPSPLPACTFRVSSYPVMAVALAGTHKGRIFVVWSDYATGDADVLLSWSDDQGATWTRGKRVNDDPSASTSMQFMPWIDVDPLGDVHIAFYDTRDDEADGCRLHLYYAHSADGGEHFDPNLRITEIDSDAKWTHHQNPPTGDENPRSKTPNFMGDYLGVDADRVGVHFVWVDTRHETSDVYAATLLRDASSYGLFEDRPATAGYVAATHSS